MKRFIVVLCAVTLWPLTAEAEPRITDIEIESSEEEVHIIIALDTPEPSPSYRFMRDNQSLRMLLIDVSAEEADERTEDQTIRRIVTRPFGNRSIVRLDPHGSPVDTLERAEAMPHPRGIVVIIERSENEVARYRAAHLPPTVVEPEDEEEEARAESEDEEEEARAEPVEDVDQAAREEEPEEESETAAVAGTPFPASPEESPAAGNDSAAATTPRGGTSSPLRAAGAAGLILLLGGVAWYLRRRRGGGGRGARGARSIDIITAKRIGPRQSLLLVDVGGQTILIGATEKGMSRLAMIPGEDETDTLIEEELIDEDDGLTPLEREIRRSLPPIERPPQKTSFQRELQGAMEPEQNSGPSLAGMIAARKMAAQAEAAGRDDIGGDAIEGLLRLRKMADGAPSAGDPGFHPPVNGKGKRNGTDMTLSDLQSLLGSRQAN